MLCLPSPQLPCIPGIPPCQLLRARGTRDVPGLAQARGLGDHRGRGVATGGRLFGPGDLGYLDHRAGGRLAVRGRCCAQLGWFSLLLWGGAGGWFCHRMVTIGPCCFGHVEQRFFKFAALWRGGHCWQMRLGGGVCCGGWFVWLLEQEGLAFYAILVCEPLPFACVFSFSL